jgi:hypothetical protein
LCAAAPAEKKRKNEIGRSRSYEKLRLLRKTHAVVGEKNAVVRKKERGRLLK